MDSLIREEINARIEDLLNRIIRIAAIFADGRIIDVPDLAPAMNLILFGSFAPSPSKAISDSDDSRAGAKHSKTDVSIPKLPVDGLTPIAGTLLVDTLTKYIKTLIRRAVTVDGHLTVKRFHMMYTEMSDIFRSEPLTKVKFSESKTVNKIANLMLTNIISGLQSIDISGIQKITTILFTDAPYIFEEIDELEPRVRIKLPKVSSSTSDYLAKVIEKLVDYLEAGAEVENSNRTQLAVINEELDEDAELPMNEADYETAFIGMLNYL